MASEKKYTDIIDDTTYPPYDDTPSLGSDLGGEQDLFDLTNQPYPVIIGGDTGQPLFSIEIGSTYTYQGGSEKNILITEKAPESLRYSKEYATTTNDHQYKITFDIIPDNISNEASFELQGGIDDIPFTFYTIGNMEGVSDTFPQINQSKSFEITFDAALDNQFLIQFKKTNWTGYIKNFKVFDLGVKDDSSDEVRDEGGSPQNPYVRACLCGDSSKGHNTVGNFKTDFINWAKQNNYAESDSPGNQFGFMDSIFGDLDSQTLGISETELPDGVYPSNCVGEYQLAQMIIDRYPRNEAYDEGGHPFGDPILYEVDTGHAYGFDNASQFNIYHDPRLCIMGGQELDPEKKNIIGLTWKDFKDENLFDINLTETSGSGNVLSVRDNIILFNKDAKDITFGSNRYESTSYPRLPSSVFDTSIGIYGYTSMLEYNFNVEQKTNDYLETLFWGPEDYLGTGYEHTRDIIYKTFADSWSTDIAFNDSTFPCSQDEIDSGDCDSVMGRYGVKWHSDYITSEKIYPIYDQNAGDESPPPIMVSGIKRGGDDNNQLQYSELENIDDLYNGKAKELVWPGRCPPQYQGEEGRDGRFGTNTLSGFGPIMCARNHFESHYSKWLYGEYDGVDGTNPETPKIKPYVPNGDIVTLEVNPDQEDVPYPVVANFPDNDTFNFIKQQFEITVGDVYRKYLIIDVPLGEQDRFENIYFESIDGVRTTFPLGVGENYLYIDITDIVPTTPDDGYDTYNGNTFNEQYGHLLVTPAPADMEVEAKLKYEIKHYFMPNSTVEKELRRQKFLTLMTDYFTGGDLQFYEDFSAAKSLIYLDGFEGTKLYQYGNNYEYAGGGSVYNDDARNKWSWWNSHAYYLWTHMGVHALDQAGGPSAQDHNADERDGICPDGYPMPCKFQSVFSNWNFGAGQDNIQFQSTQRLLPFNYWAWEFDEQMYLNGAARYNAQDNDQRHPMMHHWGNYFKASPYQQYEDYYWRLNNLQLNGGGPMGEVYEQPTYGDGDANFNEADYTRYMIDYGNYSYDPYIPFDTTWKIEYFSLTPWPEQSIINAYMDATRLPQPANFDESEGYLNDFDGDHMHGWAYNGEGSDLLNTFDGGVGKATINFFITGTLQFGGGFGVGDFDVDLNPQLDSSFDSFSGIDLRPEIVDENICSYIELMTFQNIAGSGDGLWYPASEHPSADVTEKAITCETILNFNLYPFSKVRARCSDGSTVLIGDTGNGDTINYPDEIATGQINRANDYFHLSGIDACKYASNHIRSYPNNKQYHFGANLDKRPSLGLFYYEEDNLASEEFTFDIGEEFEQYPLTNFVTNGNGQLIKTYDDVLDHIRPQSYWYIGSLRPCKMKYSANIISHDHDNDGDTDEEHWNGWTTVGDDCPNNEDCFNPGQGTCAPPGNHNYSNGSIHWSPYECGVCVKTTQDGASYTDMWMQYNDTIHNDSYWYPNYPSRQARYSHKPHQQANIREDSYTPDGGWGLARIKGYYDGVDDDNDDYFIQSGNYDSSIGWYRYMGHYSSMGNNIYLPNYNGLDDMAGGTFFPFQHQRSNGTPSGKGGMEKFQGQYATGVYWGNLVSLGVLPAWVRERAEYSYIFDQGGSQWQFGPTKRSEDTGGGTPLDAGVHPQCHSGGGCLNFHANRKFYDWFNETYANMPTQYYQWESSDGNFYGADIITLKDKDGNEFDDSWKEALKVVQGWEAAGSGIKIEPYMFLTQQQQLLDKDEATDIFYHDIQSTPDLKVSFWMLTDSHGVEDLDNPDFPEIEIGISKVDHDLRENTYHNWPKAELNSIHTGEKQNVYTGASARFKNTVLDEWEKFEFSFNLDYDTYYIPSERKFHPLFLYTSWGAPKVNGDNSYENMYGNVYLDDFSVKETGEFIPDVDVRAKKGEGEYGIGSLTEYYDPLIEGQLQHYNDTTAPLEAQFYFYPRFHHEQLFDRESSLVNRFDNPEATFGYELIANDYRRGRFYLYDIDWGDGSKPEYTTEPLRLGNDVAVYHTYTKSGIYEVTGYMLRTRPSKNDDGTPNHDLPLGVIHNKKFTVRININEGLDEDFTYFGSEDGFSYIPYKNLSPVIGGISSESSYYKNIKRQVGFIGNTCKKVEFMLDEGSGGNGFWYNAEQFYLAGYLTQFGIFETIDSGDDLSIVDCDFDFSSQIGTGYPIKNVSQIKAICEDGTTVLIGDSDGISMSINDYFYLSGNEACGSTKTSVYFEKESDKLKTELALDKMDSFYEDKFEILPAFKEARYSEPDGGGELIYGGIATNGERLGKTLGSMDLTDIRYFNQPKSIYQMFGFTCDNNQTEVDLIPLGNPEYGVNYMKHSYGQVNNDEIMSPFGSSVTKIFNKNYTDPNPIRFGHMFRVENYLGADPPHFSGQWAYVYPQFENVGTTINTPDLGYDQVYTYSTHIYIPYGHCEDGRPCSEGVSDYTVQCSDGGCNGTVQYNNGDDLVLRHIQTAYVENTSAFNDFENAVPNDWATSVWNNNETGTEWHDSHGKTFNYWQYDQYAHCHPLGSANKLFTFALTNGRNEDGSGLWGQVQMDNQYCFGHPYATCNTTEGCYWSGDDAYNGNCVRALGGGASTCWEAINEDMCSGNCYWYTGASENSYVLQLQSIPNDQIIYDEWVRIDTAFTPQSPIENGNLLTLKFTTPFGKSVLTDYQTLGDDIIEFGNFDSPSSDYYISQDFLSTLPYPNCYEKFDINEDGTVNVQDVGPWATIFNRPDISTGEPPTGTPTTMEIVTLPGGTTYTEEVEFAGGYCDNQVNGIIGIRNTDNACALKNRLNHPHDSCFDFTPTQQAMNDDVEYTPEACCELAGVDYDYVRKCLNPQFEGSYTTYECTKYSTSDDTTQTLDYNGDIDVYRNPEDDTGEAADEYFADYWIFENGAYAEDGYVFFPFGLDGNYPTLTQVHGFDGAPYQTEWILKIDIQNIFGGGIVSGEVLLVLLGGDNSYINDDIVLLGDQETGDIETGILEFRFTSDNVNTPDGGRESDYYRELTIELRGTNEGNEGSISIDWISLREVIDEGTENTVTYNDGLYTFGAQLLVGDLSGDDLINYTTEDLNPGDCADFQSGNPSNPRYWKNIIPQNFDITNRNTLGTEQEWLETNNDLPENPNYYYPVLPKYDKYGKFGSADGNFSPGGDYDYPFDNIPFPVDSNVTTEQFQDQSMIISIYNDQLQTNVFGDGSGNDNNGFVLNDYKPKFDKKTNEPKNIKNVDRIRTSKKDGAY